MSSTNGNENGSNLQRIVIGAGTLVIIVLTVVIAIFLTMQDFSSGTPTPTTIAGLTPSPTFTSVATQPETATATVTTAPVETIETDTPLPPPPTATETPIPPPSPTSTDTPLPPPTPTNTPLPPPTPTETPSQPTPTPTNTLIPLLSPSSPTQTATPIVPQIDSVAPRRVDENNDPFIMTIIGKNFFTQGPGFRAELRGPKTVPLSIREITLSDTSFDVEVPANLIKGTYDIVVTNPGGRSALRSSVLTVGPEPTPTTPEIIGFSPMAGEITEEIILTIQGRNFTPNDSKFEVELREEDKGLIFELDLGNVRTSETIEAIIRANQLQAGEYQIVIFNNSNDVVRSTNKYIAR